MRLQAHILPVYGSHCVSEGDMRRCVGEPKSGVLGSALLADLRHRPPAALCVRCPTITIIIYSTVLKGQMAMLHANGR